MSTGRKSPDQLGASVTTRARSRVAKPQRDGRTERNPEQARAGAAMPAGAGQHQQLRELQLQPIALPQDGLQPAQPVTSAMSAYRRTPSRREWVER